MSKSVNDISFFARKPLEVAKDLLGKYICRKSGDEIEEYEIIETEAYDYGEKCCYGYRNTKKDNLSDKEYAQKNKLVCLPLFNEPGTWCIYGGQLLLSVNDNNNSDNVLIKKVKYQGIELTPDRFACSMNLYKKCKYYCDYSNKNALKEDSGLYIIDGNDIDPKTINYKTRIGLKSTDEENNKEYRCLISK